MNKFISGFSGKEGFWPWKNFKTRLSSLIYLIQDFMELYREIKKEFK